MNSICAVSRSPNRRQADPSDASPIKESTAGAQIDLRLGGGPVFVCLSKEPLGTDNHLTVYMTYCFQNSAQVTLEGKKPELADIVLSPYTRVAHSRSGVRRSLHRACGRIPRQAKPGSACFVCSYEGHANRSGCS